MLIYDFLVVNFLLTYYVHEYHNIKNIFIYSKLYGLVNTYKNRFKAKTLNIMLLTKAIQEGQPALDHLRRLVHNSSNSQNAHLGL